MSSSFSENFNFQKTLFNNFQYKHISVFEELFLYYKIIGFLG